MAPSKIFWIAQAWSLNQRDNIRFGLDWGGMHTIVHVATPWLSKTTDPFKPLAMRRPKSISVFPRENSCLAFFIKALSLFMAHHPF
jgi:hypothetical protein